MASRKIEDLIPAMRSKAREVVRICKEQGVDILIYCTLRSLEEQAKFYRQSRSRAVINAKMEKLRTRGFGFLADIIEEVGSQSGAHVTNACPGESYHNYAEAFDGVPTIDGKALWSYEDNKKEWDIYGAACESVGLTWLGNSKSFNEKPHAQFRSGGSPLRTFDSEEIETILIENGLLK